MMFKFVNVLLHCYQRVRLWIIFRSHAGVKYLGSSPLMYLINRLQCMYLRCYLYRGNYRTAIIYNDTRAVVVIILRAALHFFYAIRGDRWCRDSFEPTRLLAIIIIIPAYLLPSLLMMRPWRARRVNLYTSIIIVPRARRRTGRAAERIASDTVVSVCSFIVIRYQFIAYRHL